MSEAKNLKSLRIAALTGRVQCYLKAYFTSRLPNVSPEDLLRQLFLQKWPGGGMSNDGTRSYREDAAYDKFYAVACALKTELTAQHSIADGELRIRLSRPAHAEDRVAVEYIYQPKALAFGDGFILYTWKERPCDYRFTNRLAFQEYLWEEYHHLAEQWASARRFLETAPNAMNE